MVTAVCRQSWKQHSTCCILQIHLQNIVKFQHLNWRLFILFRIKGLVIGWDERITDDVMLWRVMPRTVASIITKRLNYILLGMHGCGKGFWSWGKHVPHPVYVWQWTQHSLIVGDKGQQCTQKYTKSDINDQSGKPRNRQNHFRLHQGTMNVKTKYYSSPAADTVEPEFKFTKVLMS